MAASRFPEEWPTFIFRSFESIPDAYRKCRDFAKSIEDFRTRVAITNNDHADRLTPTEDTGVPSTTPTDILLFYLDTSTKDLYVSVGTASSADWKKITP